jgi:uncharacterized membrane protein
MQSDVFINAYSAMFIEDNTTAASGYELQVEKDKLRESITIGKPRSEVYSFWRNFENLSKFMKDVESIEILSPLESRWKVRLKNGMSAEWNAIITGEVEGESISWSSVEGSKISTSGTVWFEAGPRGSAVVRLTMNYSIPGGKLSEWATYFSGEDPQTLITLNLKRLKALLETGEVPTVEGQPSGREKNSTKKEELQ